jgi:predicted oxidoreductase
LFLVDTPEQRRMGVHDSHELALSDWMGSAQFDREEDLWPRRGPRQLGAALPHHMGDRSGVVAPPRSECVRTHRTV